MAKRRGDNKRLWAMILLAGVYLSLISVQPNLTGNRLVDGTIGIVLGLYISSHPATNAIDLMFIERTGFGHLTKEWAGIRWLALNVVVMVIGWVTIVAGATRFVG